MAIVLPSTDVSASLIRSGAGKLYIAAYQSGGADAGSYRFLGATLGGIEYDPKRTIHPIETDQYLGAIGAFPAKEEHTIKATLLDTYLKNLYDAFGMLANTLTGGDRTDSSGSLGAGEEVRRNYYQLVWRLPVLPAYEGSSTALILQLYRCVFLNASAIKGEKGKESSVQTTWLALSDPSAVAAGKPAVGKWIES